LKHKPQLNRGRLVEVLLERERLGSTGIGDGIAIPHVRNPVVLDVEKPMVNLCFLETAIPFGALDNEDVDTLFFIFPKSERRFLRIQAKLSRLLKDEDVITAVKRNTTADELYAVFSGKEKEIFRAGAAR